MVKNIKKLQTIALATILTIIAGSASMAQPGRQQGPPPVTSKKEISKLIKELDKKLDLSEEQNKKISTLYSDHFDKIEALQKNSQRPSMEKMEKLDTDLEKDVKAVLDEKQIQKYISWLEIQKKQRANPPQGGRPGGPPR